MTCIVGYLDDNGDIYMGGDSAGVINGLDLRIRDDSKVFIKDDIIYGFTSSFRMGQIIRSCFNRPFHDESIDDFNYLCNPFVDSLIGCFKEKGYLSIKDNVQTGGNFILGYKNKLYEIMSNFQVAKYAKNYAACGCGESYALGCLYALENHNIHPSIKIERALEAAQEFSAGVRKPFIVVTTSKKLLHFLYDDTEKDDDK